MFDSKDLRKIEEELREQREMLRQLFDLDLEILRRLPRPARTVSIAVSFSPTPTSTAPAPASTQSQPPKDTLAMNTLNLLIGQSSVGTVIPFLADGVTPTPGATVSNQSWSIADPSLTATPNADGTVTIAGVADSAAPVTGTVSATVTDADGTVSNLSATFTVTVTGVVPPPPARTASIGVSFSQPA